MKKEVASEVSKEQSLKKKLTNYETNLEKCRAQRLATLHSCKMEDVDVPLLHAEEEEEVPARKRRRKSGRERAALEKTSTSESFSMSESQTSEAMSQEPAQMFQIDFNDVPEEQQSADKEQYERIKSDYQRRIQIINDDLDKISPNLKAFEKLEDVANRLKM
jgi:hypothetical protein